jgi:hypothetical protein
MEFANNAKCSEASNFKMLRFMILGFHHARILLVVIVPDHLVNCLAKPTCVYNLVSTRISYGFLDL